MDEEQKEKKAENEPQKEGKATGKAAKPKKGKSKLLLLVIFIVLIGGLGGGYFLYGDTIIKKYLGKQQEGQAEAQKEDAAKKKKSGVGPILAMEPFVFNLTGNSAKFARVSLGVELKDPKVLEEAKKMVPAMRDRILSVLSTKGPDVLMDVNQRNEIKKEMYEHLKSLFKESDELKSVYITDIIIQ